MQMIICTQKERKAAMKKNGRRAGRASALIVTLVSLVMVWQGELRVHGTEGEFPGYLERTFELNSEETVQVPRYIVEGNTVYMLDEASIAVEEAEHGSAEGADVVTFSRKVEDLSDNDLARIEKKKVIEGIECELLSAVYKVEEKDEKGMPVQYSAVCEYGGLKKYGISYPTAWRLTARYYPGRTLSEPEVVEIQEEVTVKKNVGREGSTRTRRTTRRGEEEKEEKETVEKELILKPEIRRIKIKPPAKEEDKRTLNLLAPLAAGAAGTGVILPFIIWFSVLTAPLFGMKERGKYRYIGRIRLKKEGEGYTARLTKRLLRRAELPVFQIKLQKKVWKRAKAGVFSVHCPDEKKIVTIAGRTVHFTVEGD